MPFQPFSYAALPLKIDPAKRALTFDQHDGDSLWLTLDEGKYSYTCANARLFGINTPEMNDPDAGVRAKAAESKEHLRTLIGGPKPIPTHPHDWTYANDGVARFCKVCCLVEKSPVQLVKSLYVKSEKLEKYGRLLITAWSDPLAFGDNTKSINKAMIDSGYAVPFMGDL